MTTPQLLTVGAVALSIFWVLSVIVFTICLINDLLENDDDQLM